ncbi:MAG: hypothetical protein ACYDBQ_03530 [Thermoplasmatota archaeon]
MKVEWAEEQGVRARYVECPRCHVRIAMVEGFEPPGANIEQLFRESLDAHLQYHEAHPKWSPKPKPFHG